MSSEGRNEFIRATYVLSKRDPQAWVEFRDAFAAYTAYELERITTSTVENAQIAIGFGRRMKELRDDFIAIEELAVKLKLVK